MRAVRRLGVGIAMLIMVMAMMSRAASADATAQTVQIDSGRVHGEGHDDVVVFRGIPFAAPPTGTHRWRPPQPPNAWSGVRDATRFGPECMQKSVNSDAAPGDGRVSEDCLYLNVWRPARQTDHDLPVLVWLYGGGYVNGGTSSPIYDGSAFARDGLVFVSLNYRLGRFGFFAHPALEATQPGPWGNYALMDQIAGLEWVKRNIAQFGGDPDQVTIFGESAGGNAVLELAASPAARGLFQRAAVMSGGGRHLMGTMHDLREDRPHNPSAETLGQRFARQHGIDGDNDQRTAQRLRALPAAAITGQLNLATLLSADPEHATYAGGPIRDGTIVVAPPEQRYHHGNQQALPLLIGTTDRDLGLSDADTMTQLFARFGEDRALARTLYDPTPDESVEQVGRRLGRDRLMTEPARFIADQMHALGAPVWRYRFAHVAEPMRPHWAGALHATDIPYVFATLATRFDKGLSASDDRTEHLMHDYFVNFARHGDPNGPGLPYWPQHTPEAQKLMILEQRDAVAKSDPWRQQLDLIRATRAPQWQ
ncbi:carboxylesterase/lipase family protein [Kushneria phosphatilytica]|nr:carboxylesterase family protein [Kushneria phosphatilytica]